MLEFEEGTLIRLLRDTEWFSFKLKVGTAQSPFRSPAMPSS